MFVGLGLSGVVPILHALTFSTYRELDERMGLSWVILQGGLYIFGAFLYAVSIFFPPGLPQRSMLLTDVGPLPGAQVSRHLRHLGQLAPDLPRFCLACGGGAFGWHGQGV